MTPVSGIQTHLIGTIWPYDENLNILQIFFVSFTDVVDKLRHRYYVRNVLFLQCEIYSIHGKGLRFFSGVGGDIVNVYFLKANLGHLDSLLMLVVHCL